MNITNLIKGKFFKTHKGNYSIKTAKLTILLDKNFDLSIETEQKIIQFFKTL